MEVTEIILAKVSRLRQLSSHSPCLKVVCDKTAFVKFKIRNNFKLNMDETHSKQSYQPTDFKNLKKKIREPNVSRPLPNVCDFPKEKHTLRYGCKNL